jgi:hypothetical protein
VEEGEWKRAVAESPDREWYVLVHVSDLPSIKTSVAAFANIPSHFFSLSVSMVPALAVGFEDLKKRMESQNEMTELQRIKLNEIEAKMGEIMQFHMLQTASKVREFKRRHIQLAQRVLTVLHIDKLEDRGQTTVVQ